MIGSPSLSCTGSLLWWGGTGTIERNLTCTKMTICIMVGNGCESTLDAGPNVFQCGRTRLVRSAFVGPSSFSVVSVGSITVRLLRPSPLPCLAAEPLEFLESMPVRRSAALNQLVEHRDLTENTFATKVSSEKRRNTPKHRNTISYCRLGWGPQHAKRPRSTPLVAFVISAPGLWFRVVMCDCHYRVV